MKRYKVYATKNFGGLEIVADESSHGDWVDAIAALDAIEKRDEAIIALMKCIVACRYAENDLWIRERLKVEVNNWGKDEILSKLLEKV